MLGEFLNVADLLEVNISKEDIIEHNKANKEYNEVSRDWPNVFIEEQHQVRLVQQVCFLLSTTTTVFFMSALSSSFLV